MRISIPETVQPVQLLVPAADAAGRACTIFPSLKNALKAWIMVYLDQGAANTVALTPMQAKTVGNSPDLDKVLTNTVPIYSNLDMAAATPYLKETAAKNYTTDAGVKHKCIIFEIDPASALDVDGEFDCIGITTGASAAANITSAILLIQPKYKGDAQVDYITD
jgi:hypothetical protein